MDTTRLHELDYANDISRECVLSLRFGAGKQRHITPSHMGHLSEAFEQ